MLSAPRDLPSSLLDPLRPKVSDEFVCVLMAMVLAVIEQYGTHVA